MKIRSILFALSLFAVTSAAIAQDVPQAPTRHNIPEVATQQQLLEPSASSKYGPGLLEEMDYFWRTFHFQRPGPFPPNDEVRDSNRLNLYMPWNLVSVEIRGYGQFFAPTQFYNMFRNIPNDPTGLLLDTAGEVINDAAYYEQFKDAGAFTIQAIQSFWFKNTAAGTPFASATFYLYGPPAGVTASSYFGSTAATGYQRRGARFDRTQLLTLFEDEITPEEIDSTIEDVGNGQYRINPLTVVFDPPREFPANSFVMPFIVNDDAEALADFGGSEDIRDYQMQAAYYGRRRGTVQGFGANAQWKSLGLTMFRPAGELGADRDTAWSFWSSGLTIGGVQVHIDNWMHFFGTVDLGAGVTYHFGREASSQGLGSPTPNPVVTDTRIPFSLTKITDVALDLYDVNGTHIRSLVKKHYVPGNYTVALGAGDLANGTYLVRMTAGTDVYTMKVSVAK